MTSGDAASAWRLGEVLAANDESGELLKAMVGFPERGRDIRVVYGYLDARKNREGAEWLDDWLDRYLVEHPEDIDLALEATWRCGATTQGAERAALIISRGSAQPDVVAGLSFGRWGIYLLREAFGKVLGALVDRSELRATAIALLAHRVSSAPAEWDYWAGHALELATTGNLIRARHMTGHYWAKIAKRAAPTSPRELARAIFAEQARREEGAWFLEHSDALKVAYACIEADAQGVWEELHPYLERPEIAHLFTIGFPCGLVDLMPPEEVVGWVEGDPAYRASLVARIVNKAFTNDDSLAALLLDRFGDYENVGSAFFSSYVSGSWWGPASEHWRSLAKGLESVAGRTSRAGVRSWAARGAQSLYEMAGRDRRREEEEDIRRG